MNKMTKIIRMYFEISRRIFLILAGKEIIKGPTTEDVYGMTVPAMPYVFDEGALDKKPPPPFTMLYVDRPSRRFHFETLFPALVADRFRDYGTLEQQVADIKWGYGISGTLRPFYFGIYALNVAPLYDFEQALIRASGLAHMPFQDALYYNMDIFLKNMKVSELEPFRLSKSQMDFLKMPVEMLDDDQENTLVKFYADHRRHAIVMQSELSHLADDIADIGELSSYGKSPDKKVTSYFIMVHTHLDLDDAVQMLMQRAQKAIELAQVWDIFADDENGH